MLTAQEIAEMRATQATAQPETVVVQSYTTASDSMGGAVETWAASGTVTGRLSPISEITRGGELVYAERLGDVDGWVITVPRGTTVTAKDRLVINSRTFEVVSTQPHSEWETARRILAVEVG